MKYIKILLLSFVLFSVNAFALSSPSQIAAMMDSGNLTGAESALKAVLSSGKDTAKVHYMLAQVYQKEGNSPEAKNELARANQMDPEHSYTDNAHYRPIADAIMGRVVHNAAPTTVATATSAPSGSSALSALGIIIILSVLGGAAYYFLAVRSEKRKNQNELSEAEETLRANAALLIQDIDKATLNEKTSASPSAARLAAINAVNIKALNVYERSKNLHTDDINQVSSLINEVGDIRYTLNCVLSTDYDTPVTVKVKKAYAAPTSNPYAPGGGRILHTEHTPTPAAAPVITQPQPQVVHDTVVVQNSSSSVSDFLVADMLIENSRRESEDRRTREREEDDRREREERRQEEREEEEARQARQAENDSGNNDSWNSPSSDSGNNDSWNSSNDNDNDNSSNDTPSSDSGSNDSF